MSRPTTRVLEETEPPAARTVLVCHEDELVGGGLARLLEQALDVATAVSGSAGDAVATLRLRPADLVVWSERVPAHGGLAAAVRRLRDLGCRAPVLAVTRFDGARAGTLAMESGACGYVPQSRTREDLVGLAAALLDGRERPAPARRHVDIRLTDREREVLEACERGLADKQIARQLGIAVSTVRTHMRSLHRKLDASSRTEALYRARHLGLM